MIMQEDRQVERGGARAVGSTQQAAASVAASAAAAGLAVVDVNRLLAPGGIFTLVSCSRGGVGHEASAPARTGSPRGAGASAAALVSGVLAAADAVRPSLTVATALGWRTHGTAKLGSCAPGDGAEISTCTLHVFSKRGPGEA